MNRPAHELLREGAQHLDQQTRGGFALRVDHSGRLRGCALGAIAIAAQGDPAQVHASEEYRRRSLLRYLRLLATERPATQPCPGRGRWPWQGHHWTCSRITRLGNQIAHLNDRHGWSFERIAAWLQQEHPNWDIPTLLDAADATTASPYTPAAEALVRESALAVLAKIDPEIETALEAQAEAARSDHAEVETLANTELPASDAPAPTIDVAEPNTATEAATFADGEVDGAVSDVAFAPSTRLRCICRDRTHTPCTTHRRSDRVPVAR